MDKMKKFQNIQINIDDFQIFGKNMITDMYNFLIKLNM